ncbi:putative zinc finger mynd-type protein [Diplodia seriata]|uniref:Putative zinc finger mynd-type protein n=1 Tax=Diplodia seriata TaxID=420778 RepID=A0A0G2GZ63_9PEZI|nr:putative zinc finger mynd-type protein [Diplodia seriata]
MDGPRELCLACTKPAANTCARCHCSRYCSKDCQAADHATHKLLCRAYSSLNRSVRPSHEHKLGILFPPDDRKPRLVWVHFSWHEDDEDFDDSFTSRFQMADSAAHLGEHGAESQIQYNTVLQRELPNTIRIAYRDAFLKDGSHPNLTIQSLPVHRGSIFDWRGPILAYGMHGLGVDQTVSRDLDLNDLRHLADFFVTYRNNGGDGDARNDGDSSNSNKKVKGVKISCQGDQDTFGLPAFQEVEVPATHPIFAGGDHDASEIAARVGIPILTRKYPASSAWTMGSPTKHPFVNQAATSLHLACCDNEGAGAAWGWAPAAWQRDVGSVLAVREDRKPLHPLHVEALCRFCQFEMGPMFEHSLGLYGGTRSKPLKREVVLSHATRPFFELFWSKLLDQKLKESDGAASKVWDPYEDAEDHERGMAALFENLGIDRVEATEEDLEQEGNRAAV